MVKPAIDWMLYARTNGGWGYFAPTIEETAYALIALLSWRDVGHAVSAAVLQHGIDCLLAQFAPAQVDYPPLWIGKSLYTPVQVVQSAALAALLHYEGRV